MVGGGRFWVAANSSSSSRAPVLRLPDITETDQWRLVTAILACLSDQVWSTRGPMPGISGGYSFQGEQLPVDWFGERFGDAIEADVGCTKRFSVIRMAMTRLLFSSSRHSVSVSLCSKSSRAAKVRVGRCQTPLRTNLRFERRKIRFSRSDHFSWRIGPCCQSGYQSRQSSAPLQRSVRVAPRRPNLDQSRSHRTTPNAATSPDRVTTLSSDVTEMH